MTVNELLEKLCKEYILKETRSKYKYRLVTPFTMPNGEAISFTVEIKNENEILLDDAALVYRYFDLNFFEPKTSALDSIGEICKNFGISSADSFSKIINTNDKFAIYDFYDYINAIIRLSDILFFKTAQKEKSDFLDRFREFIKNNLTAEYRYFREGIKPYDANDDFVVDAALSNDNQKWVIVNGIYTPSNATEINLSLMYYKYKMKLDVESILIFDDLDKYAKRSKINRLLNDSDTTIATFDEQGQKKLEDVVRKRLHK